MLDEPWLSTVYQQALTGRKWMAWDIGANAGQWTARLAEDFHEVVSFEPDHRCTPPIGYAYDRRAVSHATGTALLYMRGSPLQSSLLREHGVGASRGAPVNVVDMKMVPCVTLDDLAHELGQPDFIKMDIEGGEHAALSGATLPVFSRCRWLIESHDQRVLVASHLSRLGYSNVTIVAHPHDDAAPGHEWIYAAPTA